VRRVEAKSISCRTGAHRESRERREAIVGAKGSAAGYVECLIIFQGAEPKLGSLEKSLRVRVDGALGTKLLLEMLARRPR